MKLVIVESPAKAKVISKYLGAEYKVLSSYGHIRDLPSHNGSVEPENNFVMHYELLDKSLKPVRAILDAAKKAEAILLATDPDREGEAISWHVIEAIKEKKALKKHVAIKRVVFHEITKTAVLKAIQEPREISMDLVNAQQARRALDYLVGFTLSPILWKKLPGSRSAGRVQSVALRLICDRESEIEAFRTQEYWSIACNFSNAGTSDEFEAKLHELDGNKLEKFSIITGDAASSIEARLKRLEYEVEDVATKTLTRNPNPPFITSTLQQEAFNQLNFPAKKTMSIAQSLYEGVSIGNETVGLITYMRTDGTQLASDAVAEIRNYISKEAGGKYLPSTPRHYKTKVKNAQEAHEAIRPTSAFRTPQQMTSYLSKDQLAVYSLIWKRAVSCQMTNASFEQMTVTIASRTREARLKSVGSRLAFDGFYKIYGRTTDEEHVLPPLKPQSPLTLNSVKSTQHFTEPPPRYSEATLIKQLEEFGVGRPSTYAAIISVILDRKYACIRQKKFAPEDRGRLVVAFLKKFCQRYIDPEFTASLEEELDLISDAKLNWKEMLLKFWSDFHATTLAISVKPMEEVLEVIVPEIESYVFAGREEDRRCKECERGRLHIRIGKYGPFVACDRYPECGYTRPLHTAEEQSEEHREEAGQHHALGVDPHTNKQVLLKHGPFGMYWELLGDPHPKRSHIPDQFKDRATDLHTALKFLSLPRQIGLHPESGEMISANIGRYGPYLLHNKKFTNLKVVDDVFQISLSDAVSLINSNQKTGSVLGQFDGQDVTLMSGKFGPYVRFGKLNVKVPKDASLGQAIELIRKKIAKT